MIAHHGLFQGYYYFEKLGAYPAALERNKTHPAYDTSGIDSFAPMVERVFGPQSTRKSGC